MTRSIKALTASLILGPLLGLTACGTSSEEIGANDPSLQLPISVVGLIILILIAGPILCATTVILTHRVDSKLERSHLDERRANVASREYEVAGREEAVEGREWVAAEWESMLQERRLELSRQAHDLDDLVRGQMVLMDDDTTIQNIWNPDDLPAVP